MDNELAPRADLGAMSGMTLLDLPIDIIQKILFSGLESSIGDQNTATSTTERLRRQYLTRILGVSSRFRAIARGTSSLWSSIIVCYQTEWVASDAPRQLNTSPHWDFIETCLELSQARLLDITLQYLDETSCSDMMAKAFELLIPVSPQWRRLTIFCVEHDRGNCCPLQPALNPRAQLDCGNLRSILIKSSSISSFDFTEKAVDEVITLMDKINAPQLEHLSFSAPMSSIERKCLNSWSTKAAGSSVTTLGLRALANNFDFWVTYAALFPNLLVLRVGYGHCSYGRYVLSDVEANNRIVLPTLRHLYFEMISATHNILDFISAPKLRSLGFEIVEIADRNRMQTMKSLLTQLTKGQQSFPVLDTLAIAGLPWDFNEPEMAVDLLTSFPAYLSNVIFNSDSRKGRQASLSTALQCLANPETGVWAFPSISSVTFVGVECQINANPSESESATTISSFIHERRAAAQQLEGRDAHRPSAFQRALHLQDSHIPETELGELEALTAASISTKNDDPVFLETQQIFDMISGSHYSFVPSV